MREVEKQSEKGEYFQERDLERSVVLIVRRFSSTGTMGRRENIQQEELSEASMTDSGAREDSSFMTESSLEEDQGIRIYSLQDFESRILAKELNLANGN